MSQTRTDYGFARLDAFEGRLCAPCNELARLLPVRAYFRAASRLGDGIAWYAMLAILPVAFGLQALLPTLHMVLTGMVGVALYKLLKDNLVRERPFASHANVTAVSRPLDRYSFPSGHTMHAVSFLTLLAAYFPGVMWIMLPFAISVALSRVVLGLHYPSDVLAGALIGWLLAKTSLLLTSGLLPVAA